MRTLLLHAAIAALAILPPTPEAGAQERPLICEFARNAPTAYTARLGSRLPIGAERLGFIEHDPAAPTIAFQRLVDEIRRRV